MADHRTVASPHTAHDAILVAALAAGDLADLAKTDAEALVAACPDCAALHADLRAISVATRALPAPVRTRDFRLTPAQAERLRPSGLRRWLAALASPRSAATRPLAIAFTTLGLAGLLLTAIPAGGPAALFSGAAERQAATASDTDAGAAGAPVAPATTPEPALGGGSVAPVPVVPAGPAARSTPDRDTGATSDETYGLKDELGSSAEPTLEDRGRPWLALLSTSLLVVGLGLFALRVAARRSSTG